MFNQRHDLAQEFPEYKDRIHSLKESNAHFARLFEEYQEADKEAHRIEQEIETVSDAYAEEVKKKRLVLKDQLFAMLTRPAA